MSFRDKPVGFLVVFDRLHGDRPFNEEDERLLQAFAASAATAVATAQNASEEALRRGIEASEAERTRWARELHDETLQQLAGLRVLLAGARRSGDAERMSGAIDGALEQITTAIGDLRSLITELRPAALDELGDQARARDARRALDAPDRPRDPARRRLLETGASRGTRRRSSRRSTGSCRRRSTTSPSTRPRPASRCRLRRRRADRRSASATTAPGSTRSSARNGFGLLGMRERLALVNGELRDGLRRRARAPSCARTSRHGKTPCRDVVTPQAVVAAPSNRLASGSSIPRGTTITGQCAERSSRPLTPPTRTERSGP